MQIIKPITDDEMIWNFLKAEFESSRFRKGSLRALEMLKVSKQIIDSPDFTDEEENKQRAAVLHLTRGWPNEELFTNFPANTTWTLGRLTKAEVAASYRLNSSRWPNRASRKVSTVIREIENGVKFEEISNDIIESIISRVNSSAEVLPIIMVSKSLDDDRTLIEGHTRALAYASSKCEAETFNVILGVSLDMKSWAYY
ncbi:MAG: hypothetical protein ACR2FM_00565 [Candidatus Saccharimonadales bacterium]